MKPYSILTGDLLAKLPTLEACSMDAVFCDPPYHLTTNKKGGSGPASLSPNTPAGRARIGTGFMGKAWDGGDIAFRPETWAAILRVMKPGAMLMAFGGTRTHHRLMCAIEDAGFEIRDCMMFLHGQGFPKSLDIGKAIDKAADYRYRSDFRRAAVSAVEECGLTLPGNSKWDWSKGEHAPGNKWWNTFQEWLPTLSDQSRKRIERKIIGKGYRIHRDSPVKIVPTGHGWYDITAPSTEAAKTWDGYGTALKPAWEPIILAMKPCEGTFAENALKWGVAGLAIDAARIETSENLNGGAHGKINTPRHDGAERYRLKIGGAGPFAQPTGRWPANVLLDEDAGARLDQMSGQTKSTPGPYHHADYKGVSKGAEKAHSTSGHSDSGGASRFFYCAKASRSERGEGNTHPTVKPLKLTEYLSRIILPPKRDTPRRILVPFSGSGSEMIGALNAGWDEVVGIERDPEYAKIARRRLAVSSAPLKRNAAA